MQHRFSPFQSSLQRISLFFCLRGMSFSAVLSAILGVYFLIGAQGCMPIRDIFEECLPDFTYDAWSLIIVQLSALPFHAADALLAIPLLLVGVLFRFPLYMYFLLDDLANLITFGVTPVVLGLMAIREIRKRVFRHRYLSLTLATVGLCAGVLVIGIYALDGLAVTAFRDGVLQESLDAENLGRLLLGRP